MREREWGWKVEAGRDGDRSRYGLCMLGLQSAVWEIERNEVSFGNAGMSDEQV